MKPCPFCGKSVAELSNLQDCEICANFEDCPECYESVGLEVGADFSPCPRFIVCAVNKGGCGASTGWYYNLDKLIGAWNKRAGEQNDTT